MYNFSVSRYELRALTFLQTIFFSIYEYKTWYWSRLQIFLTKETLKLSQHYEGLVVRDLTHEDSSSEEFSIYAVYNRF